MDESKRIRNFKTTMIKELPFFPNDRETLKELKVQHFSDVLIHYLHWKTRIVPPRPRKVQIATEVTSDTRWRSLKSGINALLEKVRNGEDLYPYLSQRAHKYGYTPAQRIRDGLVDTWDDKDQLLNTKGFYHFHLNMDIQSTGLSLRTNDVLFAFVSRQDFHAVGIFDHSVFDSKTIDGNLTPERDRMWDLHGKYMSLGLPPGSVYMSNPIMSSGHPMFLIRLSDHYAEIIIDNDPKLDDRLFVNNLYQQGGLPPPNKFNFEWRLDSLDLGIFDKRNDVYFCINRGYL